MLLQISTIVLLFNFVHLSEEWESNYLTRTRCWSSGNGQKARWWTDGKIIVRGKYWYQCRQGQLEPRGCVVGTNQQLTIGSTTITGDYVAICELGRDGYLQFRYVACVGSGNRHYRVGEQWVDEENTYYYECEKDGPYLKGKLKGCISHDKQRKVAIGQQDDYGEYTYECRENYNGTIQMCSVGCIHNGKHYKVGEQWPDGEFLFYCRMSDGRSQKVCIGCLYRQKRLYDGDRYHEDVSVFQCEIRQDSYGHKPVACLSKELDGSTVERVIGCRWYLQDSKSKIEQTCELNGSKTHVRTIGCIYRHNGYDTIFLSPGRYTIWNLPYHQKTSIGLACLETPDGAKLDVFDVSQISYYTKGLVYDQPRGK